MPSRDFDARLKRIEQAIEEGCRTGKLPLGRPAPAGYRPDAALAAIHLLLEAKPLPEGLSDEEAHCARVSAAMILLARGLPPPPGLTPEELAAAEYYAPAVRAMEEYPCPNP